MFTVKRDTHNPLLSPKSDHHWENIASFNWSPTKDGRKTRVVYRAQSEPQLRDGIQLSISSIGTAESIDGINFENRRELVVPSEEWDHFGCEDPRITNIDGTNYIFYTGLSKFPFSADGIRVALAKTTDFKTIEKHPVTTFNAKAMALFPEKINGKYAALLTAHTDLPPSEICYVEFEKESDMWSPEFWDHYHNNLASHIVPLRRADHDQVELGSAPIKTSKGWLIIYSHIQHYGEHPTFGIEACLLDLKNPRKIIGRTKGAFMVSEEYYEKVGVVGNLIFPSGAMVQGDMLEIYYGAADTHGCVARVKLDDLLSALTAKKPLIKRYAGNPIIKPRKGVAFESRGTFNPAAIDIDNIVRIFYRAVSGENQSTFGYAESSDGFSIDSRLSKPVYVPRADFEKPGGCEDPRTVIIGDRLFVFYTAYDGQTPRVAESSISLENLKAKKWIWDEPRLVTLPSVVNKDACVFPRQIDGHYAIIHRPGDHVCLDFLETLDFTDTPVRSCIPILSPRPGMWDGARVGLACPPIETPAGWLLFYHGISNTSHYRVGAVLLDKHDPTLVLSRTALPIFEPEEDYERKGEKSGVIFPCGIVRRGGTLFLYYGAADDVVGVASLKLKDIVSILTA